MRVYVRAMQVIAVAMIGNGCPSQGQVFANPAPGRYTIQNNGLPTGTVRDNETGLVWQQAASAKDSTWSDAVSYCAHNTPDLPGSGWRLPSVKELMTIVDFKRPHGGLAEKLKARESGQPSPGSMIDATAFPNTPSSLFWTSSAVAGSPGGVWNVSFDNGESSARPTRPAPSLPTFISYAGFVRCVRAPASNSSSSSRSSSSRGCVSRAGWACWPMPNPPSTGLANPASYDTNTVGVVVDNVTHLMWQQHVDPDSQPQSSAQTYCAHLSLAGQHDWRLPTMIELSSLLDFTQSGTAIFETAFPETPADWFWTSSSVVGSPGNAWGVNFGYGALLNGSNTHLGGRDGKGRIRCVR
jgi:hypothetical protein